MAGYARVLFTPLFYRTVTAGLNLSPLVDFLQEAARAYSNLNPLERGVFVLTRAVLGNRRARNAFIVYAIGLHLLVMFTLYECTMSLGSGTPVRIRPVPAPL